MAKLGGESVLRGDAVLSGYALLGVDVDLYECHLSGLGFGLGELAEYGGDGFAGPAPVCVEVGDYIGGAAEDGVELRCGCDGSDSHRV